MEFPKPKIIASSCLEHEKVRYNGQVIPSQIIKNLEPYVEFTRICPEYEIGLGVPREPIRIVKKDNGYRLIQHNTNKDVTDEMNKFSSDFIKDIKEVDGFIFKSKSPTMGVKNIKVYSGMKGSPVIEKCGGFFAGKIAEKFKDYPIEEDDRLRNNKIRDHFLTRLFLFAGFRQCKDRGSFHKHNKLLLSFYDKEKAKILDINGDSYFQDLKKIMIKPPTTEKIMRFFQDLSDNIKEKIKFLDCLNRFKDNQISLDTLKQIAKFAINDKELLETSFFNLYPPKLKPQVEEDRDRNYWK